jgi:hypothetical protein
VVVEVEEVAVSSLDTNFRRVALTEDEAIKNFETNFIRDAELNTTPEVSILDGCLTNEAADAPETTKIFLTILRRIATETTTEATNIFIVFLTRDTDEDTTCETRIDTNRRPLGHLI